MRLLCAMLVLPLLLTAAAPPSVTEFVTNLADALAQDDSQRFLSYVSTSLPEYQTLQGDVESLLARYDVTSVVEILRNEGDETSQRIELDWVLTTNDKGAVNGAKQTRRAFVKCSLRREGKRWKLEGMEPARFFR